MLLPVAWQKLDRRQQQLLEELALQAQHLRQQQTEIDRRVVGLRSKSVSWDNIGIALGVTGRAASKRYGQDS